MANIGHQKSSEQKRSRILHAAAKLFLTNGYSKTKVQDIAKEAGVSSNTIFFFFEDKEGVLSELVRYVLEGQFSTTTELLRGKTTDKLLFYAAETTLQLHMAESSENIRELYAVCYSMPKSTAVIQDTITGKLENIFREHLPHLETKDFYKLEIASGGIMRGFMTIPCTMWFTMDQKVESFLACTFKIYDVPMERIREAVEFVSHFDFVSIAQKTIDSMLSYLESRT